MQVKYPFRGPTSGHLRCSIFLIRFLNVRPVGIESGLLWYQIKVFITTWLRRENVLQIKKELELENS